MHLDVNQGDVRDPAVLVGHVLAAGEKLSTQLFMHARRMEQRRGATRAARLGTSGARGNAECATYRTLGHRQARPLLLDDDELDATVRLAADRGAVVVDRARRPV